ncbi:MAG: gamma carbonic anhydrase family protein, partial [Pseudomonadota bacterium]
GRLPLYELDGVAPECDSESWVAPSADVIGKVTLKRHASLWYGAVARGDDEQIVIGEDSNIQDGTVLHTDEGYPLKIGKGVTVGHMAMLHGCEIGDNSLIGISATVLSGAKIGKNCIIGAKALIPEGKVIPDGSLVMGVPGKVVRMLDEEAIEGIRQSAAHYVANWQRFASGIKGLPAS